MGEQVSTRRFPLNVDGKFHHRSPVMVLLPLNRHAACGGPSVLAPTLEKLVGPRPMPGRPAQSSLAGGAAPPPPMARTVKTPVPLLYPATRMRYVWPPVIGTFRPDE